MVEPLEPATRPPPRPDRGPRRVRTPFAGHVSCYILLGVLLCYVMVVRWLRPVRIGEPVDVAPALLRRAEQRIDPNTASWAELARLPGIGEVIAKRIVCFRNANGATGRPASPTTRPGIVFRRPEDLARVRGIGPKTVRKVARYLKFPPSADRWD